MRTYESDLYLMRGRSGAGGGFGGELLLDSDSARRGAGIGSIFGNIFSSVVPFIKRAFNLGSTAARSSTGKAVGRELKRSATEAGVNVLSDALKGRNIIKSSKRQLARVADNLGEKLARATKPADDGGKRRGKKKKLIFKKIKRAGGKRRGKKKKSKSKKKRKGKASKKKKGVKHKKARRGSGKKNKYPPQRAVKDLFS